MDFWIQVIVMFFAVLSGALLVHFITKSNALRLMLSFSGGFLLTIIFTHILPETYAINYEGAGYFVLIGFLIQLCLEYFSGGAEHGHMHGKSGSGFSIVIFLSLVIHSLLEAVPLAHDGHAHIDDLFWGVIAHKLPVAVVLMTMFKSAQLSETVSWIFILIFAITGPLGMVMGGLIGESNGDYLSYLLLIAIGMFLHISTTIIFESSEGHKLNIYKFLAILAGFGVGMLLN